MKFRHAIAIACAGLASACSVPAAVEPEAALPPLALQQDKPAVALLEHLLTRYFAADLSARPTVCVALHDGRSAEAVPQADEVALIARFDQLAPLSRCTQDGAAWKDAETGEPGMLFEVVSLSCASATLCNARAGYIAGPGASDHANYSMEFDGRWKITQARQ